MSTPRHDQGDINEEQCELFAGRAGPKWTKHDVRLAREVVKPLITQHLERSCMKMIAQGAWRHVPEALDPNKFEAIASRRDNPAYVTAHDRQDYKGSSGIGQEK